MISSAISAGSACAQTFALPAPPPGVETFRDSGIEFSRVRVSNVEAFVPGQTSFVNRPIGGGSWDFSISRTELTQADWIPFINAYVNVPIPSNQPWSLEVINIMSGLGWGGNFTYPTTLGTQGRREFAATPLGEVLPVEQMGWVGAAMYCNWLTNDKVSTVENMLTGAYDLRTLGSQSTDVITRLPSAKYWIPSYDEWAVASFYDPQRSIGSDGIAVAGWWSHLNARDRLPIPGAPGEGETSSGWDPGNNAYDLLPVASYANSQSPWGLFDTSGTRPEHVEDRSPYTQGDRMWVGTIAGPLGGVDREREWLLREQIGEGGGASPLYGPYTFRVATSVVPSPSSLVTAGLSLWTGVKRRRPLR